MPSNSDKLLDRIQNLLDKEDVKNEWGHKRNLMLDNMIDVGQFICNILEEYASKKKKGFNK